MRGWRRLAVQAARRPPSVLSAALAHTEASSRPGRAVNGAAGRSASDRRKRHLRGSRGAPAPSKDEAAWPSASASSSPTAAAATAVPAGRKKPSDGDRRREEGRAASSGVQAALKDGKPWITVMGLGGAGSNAVNNMIASQLEGVEFIVANTDCQALGRSLAPHKVTLGKDITRGLGAGSKPELGRRSAELQRDEVAALLRGSNMLFITGGMGGGTCTGAAPVVAQIARELGILTVGVVSTPFRSEGPNRTRVAHQGVKELAKAVDTLIVVPNQNLLALATPQTTMIEAFRYADDVLLDGVKGVTDLIVRPGLVNLDFADIKTILAGAGRALMGSGRASGADRARQAAEQALVTPLLGELPTESARGLLVTIRGGEDLALFEVDRIMEIIRGRVADDANIIFGTCYDASLEGSVHVSIIVSGIQTDVIAPPVARDLASAGARIIDHEDDGEAPSKPPAGADAAVEAAAEPPRKGLFGRFFSL